MRVLKLAAAAAPFFLTVAAPSALLAQDIHSEILGAWTLDSWTVTDSNGEVHYPYGPNATGVIMYTDDGKMSVQLVNPDIEPQAENDIQERYFAYYGDYVIDEANQTVKHNLEGSMEPSWVGTVQIRAYELTDDPHLSLTAELDERDSVAASAGATGTNTLIWKRFD